MMKKAKTPLGGYEFYRHDPDNRERDRDFDSGKDVWNSLAEFAEWVRGRSPRFRFV
jgi:hypothetical protein